MALINRSNSSSTRQQANSISTLVQSMMSLGHLSLADPSTWLFRQPQTSESLFGRLQCLTSFLRHLIRCLISLKLRSCLELILLRPVKESYLKDSTPNSRSVETTRINRASFQTCFALNGTCQALSSLAVPKMVQSKSGSEMSIHQATKKLSQRLPESDLVELFC